VAARLIIPDFACVQLEMCGLSNDKAKYETKFVVDNGFNPVYNEGKGETFEFCVNTPDAAMIAITVWDKDVVTMDDFIGSCTIPLLSLRGGVRHVPIYDKHHAMISKAGVLCK